MNEKKNHVIQVAKQLFAEKGISDYSVQDIIEKSGISKGTFYNYFSAKNTFYIDYLHAAKQDAQERRNELIAGESVENRDIFAKQILTRVEINREYTLLPIFEIAFYSNDQTLKQVTKQYYTDELRWIAARLIDLYGPDARSYAEDCAVLLHGMLQNIVQTYKIIGNKSIDFLTIIYYVLQQIDLMMKRMIIVQDIALFRNQFANDGRKETGSTESIIKDLKEIHAVIPQNQAHIVETIDFLIDELEKDTQRIHIMKPIARSLKSILDRTEWASMYQPTYDALSKYLHENS